jgi:hypothetical protein
MSSSVVVKMDRTKNRLEALEETIRENLKAFYEIGRALKEIRDTRLYKMVLGYETFEDYCKDRWDMGRDYSYKLIGSAQVVENLENVDHGIQKPVSEPQTRPLTKLSPPLQVEAWKQSIKTAPDGKITAAHVSKTVRRIISGKNEKKDPIVVPTPIPKSVVDLPKKQTKRQIDLQQKFYRKDHTITERTAFHVRNSNIGFEMRNGDMVSTAPRIIEIEGSRSYLEVRVVVERKKKCGKGLLKS